MARVKAYLELYLAVHCSVEIVIEITKEMEVVNSVYMYITKKYL